MNYTIEIRVDVWGSDGFPHTFLNVTDSNGTSINYGFAPEQSGHLVGSGNVEIEPVPNGEIGHEYSSTSGKIPITEEQYNDLINYINQTDANPYQYNLPLGAQCAVWAMNGLQDAGIISQPMAPDYVAAKMDPILGMLQTLIYNPYVQKIGFEISDLFNSAQDFVGGGGDPLVLDLDGDGIETVGIDSTTHVIFDTNGDGLKTGTGWVGKDDGLLVLDRNGNGTIDNGGELFGDQTLVTGVKTTDGFSALRAEDTNTDGIFDANDANFTNVRIWQDKNQNGISEAGELHTLSDLSITSINLAAEEHTVINNGNTQTDIGNYTKTDGSMGTVGNLVFTQESFYREFADTIPLSEVAKALPEMQGSGLVRDLNQAVSMQTDEGRALLDVLTQYSSLSTRDEQIAMIDTLITAWGNTSGLKDLSIRAQEHGYIFSTNLSSLEQVQLLALEQFNGRGYWRMPWDDIGAKGARSAADIGEDEIGNKYINTVKWRDWAILDTAYSALQDSVYAGLILQTRLAPYLNSIDFTFDNNGLKFNFDAMDTKLIALQSSDARNALIDTLELLHYAGNTLIQSGWEGGVLLSDMLHNAEGSIDTKALLNELNMGEVDDTPWLTTGRTMVGSSSEDILYGSHSGDQLIGLNGNDMLRVFEGDNTLIGGRGNDTLIGGMGNDTYIFSKGDGHDTIYEDMTNSIDTLLFTKSINPNEVSIWRDQANMYFGINVTDDVVTVVNQYDFYTSSIERVQFSDGTVWDSSVFNAAKFVGTDKADSIYGTLEDNIIQGLAGNDQLYGDDGDDTYIFNLGDGQDTIGDYSTNTGNSDSIEFGVGISASMVTMTRDQSNLYLSINGTTDKITVSGHFDMAEYQIEQVKFADGTLWNSTLINSVKFVGTSGDDYFYGTAGNDVIEASQGNDTLNGGEGNDTYVFNLGDGQDSIFDSNTNTENQDTVQFSPGITKDSIAIYQDGVSLILSYGDTDGINIIDQFNTTNIEKFTLADGNYLTSNDLNVIIQSMNAYATDHGMSITSLDLVKANQDLMNIVAGAWHQ